MATFPRPKTWRWTKRTVIGCLTCQSNGIMGGPWPMKAAIYSRPSAVSLKVWLCKTSRSMYRGKREGANIEPWGRPQVRWAIEEEKVPSLTKNFLSDKNDWIHLRTVPFRPASDSNLDIKIEWSTVSNAADKSKRTRTTESPESVAKRISFNTLKKAISVLWADLKPDWKISVIQLRFRKNCSWSNTIFSKTWDRSYSE